MDRNEGGGLVNPLSVVKEFLPAGWVQTLANYQTEFIASLLIVVGAVIAVRLFHGMINRRVDSTNRRYILRKINQYTLTSLTIITLAVIWVPDWTTILTVTGFIAAGLTIAMRDVIMSIFGWFKIVTTGLLSVGDRVQIQDHRGDVVDITLLHTVLMETGNWVNADQSTGRLAHVPNSHIFERAVYNSTLGFPFLWDEFSIVITYESDEEAAERLMKEETMDLISINYEEVQQYLREMNKHYAIKLGELHPAVYVRPEDHGVQLSLRYMAPTRGRRDIRSTLTRRIKRKIDEHETIDLAYPTYRVYRQGEEQQLDFGDDSPPAPSGAG